MSIFGETTSDLPEASSPAQSIDDDPYLADYGVDIASAQQRQDFDTFIEDVLEDSDGGTSSPGSSANGEAHDSQTEGYGRANRFRGTAAQWKQFTSQERGLISSLDHIRAGDLSLHLYNAHVLGKRPSPPVSEQDEDTDQEATRSPRKPKRRKWFSVKTWTAWPMTPDIVPRPHEQYVGSPGQLDLANPSAEGLEQSSTDMLEQLYALLQRAAKRQWAASGGMVNPDEAGPSLSKEHPVDTHNFVVLADDEQARAILQPTARAVLAQLDRLFLGLHHSRMGHYVSKRVAKDRKGITTGRRNALPTEKLRDRSPERCPSRSRSQGTSRSETRASSKGGRPKIYHDKRPDESHYGMLKRLSTEQSQPRGQQGLAGETPRPREGERHYQMYRRLTYGTPPNVTHDKVAQAPPETATNRLNLPSRVPRDWSEVLGMAAQQNFSEAAIQRVARRCEQLFGESMTFRSLAADQTTAPSAQHGQQGQATSSARKKRRSRVSDAEQRLRCPLTTCKRNSHRFVDRKARDRHVAETHGPDVLEQFAPERILVGGIHQDEFLQIIPRLVGAGQT